jgi:hypothetical protein
MIHNKRSFNVSECISLEEVSEALFDYTNVSCQAFKWESLTLFNDSFGVNGAQEYAVYKAGVQLESLTVSWMESSESLAKTLKKLNENGSDIVMSRQMPNICKAKEHRCQLCA